MATRFSKIFVLAAIVGLAVFSSCNSIKEMESDVDSRITALEDRVTALEKLCAEMNSNITALQGIVNAATTGDYITNVTPLVTDGVTTGYTIEFAKSDPITIYYGKDGVNGTDGTNGTDGHTPAINVKQDTDGIWYWTIDGEWLLDENCQKVKAVGLDGKDGADGKDGLNGTDGKDGINGQNGADGQPGADGKDGITPQLKIEDGYWYVSTDNGQTWERANA